MNVSVTSGNDNANFSQTIYFFDENLNVFTNPDLLARTVAIYLSGRGGPTCPNVVCNEH